MNHELAREATFLADDLGMNNGDFAFIFFRTTIKNILLSLHIPDVETGPFFARYEKTASLNEKASKSFQNVLTISLVIKKDNLISDSEVRKTVSNLTMASPFNRTAEDVKKFKVGGNIAENKLERKTEFVTVLFAHLALPPGVCWVSL